MSVDVSVSPKPNALIRIRETPRGFLVERSANAMESRGRVVGSASSASVLAVIWAKELGASAEELEELRAVGREVTP